MPPRSGRQSLGDLPHSPIGYVALTEDGTLAEPQRFTYQDQR